MSDLQYIPYLYLGRHVQLIPPLSTDEIVNLSLPLLATPESTVIPLENNYQYRVTSNQNIRNGPGIDYDITQTITTHTQVYPSCQTTDINGTVWLQIGQLSWIQARVIESEGECTVLPSIDDEYSYEVICILTFVPSS